MVPWPRITLVNPQPENAYCPMVVNLLGRDNTPVSSEQSRNELSPIVARYDVVASKVMPVKAVNLNALSPIEASELGKETIPVNELHPLKADVLMAVILAPDTNWSSSSAMLL